jgi:hypothetical protein
VIQEVKKMVSMAKNQIQADRRIDIAENRKNTRIKNEEWTNDNSLVASTPDYEKKDVFQKTISVLEEIGYTEDEITNMSPKWKLDNYVSIVAALEEKPGETGGNTPEVIKPSLYKTENKNDNYSTATIGTFNIEWLGGCPYPDKTIERTDQDYKDIAGIIKDTDAAVMGIQEIHDQESFMKVMEHLPEHGFILGKEDFQGLGIIFDKNRVEYDANSIEEVDEFTLGWGERLRAPLTVDMKIDDGFDFKFAVLHKKSGMFNESKNLRKVQAGRMDDWLQEQYETNHDKDVVVVGDFNDFADSDSLSPLNKEGSLYFATMEKNDNENFYSNIPWESAIDHIAVSNVEKGAVEQFIPGSVRTIDESKYDNYLERISDHKPILLDVRTDIDDD